MKMLLALIIALSASTIVYDRAFQHHAFLNHSPSIQQCAFVPLLIYGQNLRMRGYFEKGKCCKIKDTHCSITQSL